MPFDQALSTAIHPENPPRDRESDLLRPSRELASGEGDASRLRACARNLWQISCARGNVHREGYFRGNCVPDRIVVDHREQNHPDDVDICRMCDLGHEWRQYGSIWAEILSGGAK